MLKSVRISKGRLARFSDSSHFKPNWLKFFWPAFLLTANRGQLYRTKTRWQTDSNLLMWEQGTLQSSCLVSDSSLPWWLTVRSSSWTSPAHLTHRNMIIIKIKNNVDRELTDWIPGNKLMGDIRVTSAHLQPHSGRVLLFTMKPLWTKACGRYKDVMSGEKAQLSLSGRICWKWGSEQRLQRNVVMLQQQTDLYTGCVLRPTAQVEVITGTTALFHSSVWAKTQNPGEASPAWNSSNITATNSSSDKLSVGFEDQWQNCSNFTVQLNAQLKFRTSPHNEVVYWVFVLFVFPKQNKIWRKNTQTGWMNEGRVFCVQALLIQRLKRQRGHCSRWKIKLWKIQLYLSSKDLWHPLGKETRSDKKHQIVHGGKLQSRCFITVVPMTLVCRSIICCFSCFYRMHTSLFL